MVLKDDVVAAVGQVIVVVVFELLVRLSASSRRPPVELGDRPGRRGQGADATPEVQAAAHDLVVVVGMVMADEVVVFELVVVVVVFAIVEAVGLGFDDHHLGRGGGGDAAQGGHPTGRGDHRSDRVQNVFRRMVGGRTGAPDDQVVVVSDQHHGRVVAVVLLAVVVIEASKMMVVVMVVVAVVMVLVRMEVTSSHHYAHADQVVVDVGPGGRRHHPGVHHYVVVVVVVLPVPVAAVLVVIRVVVVVVTVHTDDSHDTGAPSAAPDAVPDRRTPAAPDGSGGAQARAEHLRNLRRCHFRADDRRTGDTAAVWFDCVLRSSGAEGFRTRTVPGPRRCRPI